MTRQLMDRLLLLAIAEFADRTDRPTIALLATFVHVPESEVRQALHRLEDVGGLVVVDPERT